MNDEIKGKKTRNMSSWGSLLKIVTWGEEEAAGKQKEEEEQNLFLKEIGGRKNRVRKAWETRKEKE